MVRARSIRRCVQLAVMAMLALSGVAAASASAYTNPILENAKGEHVSKVKFTGKDEDGPFPVVNHELITSAECSSETSTGELSTTGTGAAATTSGTATLLFKKCNVDPAGKCQTLGRNAGEVEEKVALSLVWVGKESEEKPGLRVAIPPLSAKPGNGEGGKLDMKCWGDTFETEGAFIGRLNRKLGEGFTETEFLAKQTAAKQEDKNYTAEGKEGEIHLYSRWNEGNGANPFEETATKLETERQTYGETVKIAKS
jgi:hypothetical protein